MSTKFPATEMVLGMVSNVVHVMPSYIFPQSFRINDTGYVEMQDTIVKPQIDEVWSGTPYIFQQYSEHFHKTM